MYNGIENTRSYLTDRTAKLCDTFAPHHGSKSTRLAIDMISLGISLILSPYWNKGMSDCAIAIFSMILLLCGQD